jgi:hypothetical protein
MTLNRSFKLLVPAALWAALCACQFLTGPGPSTPTPTPVPPTDTLPAATAKPAKLPTHAPALTKAPPANTPAPTAAPTKAAPTKTAPKALTSLRLAVRAPDNTTQILDTHLTLDPAAPPAMNGLVPSGGWAQTSVYVLDYSDQIKAVAVDASGIRTLDFVKSPNYGLAVWPGTADATPRLAWGTQLVGDTPQATLMVGAVDGTHVDTLLSEPGETAGPHQLVAERWSADGQTLYFSREPVGIGGYILFSGASSLSRMDVASRKVTDLIPFSVQGAGRHMICLDALSADDRLVADHCTEKVITVRDLTTGQSTTLQPPAGAAGFGVLGSARFSPDGARVAYALAKGDATAEQGWVAVSAKLSGASQLCSPVSPASTSTWWAGSMRRLCWSKPTR